MYLAQIQNNRLVQQKNRNMIFRFAFTKYNIWLVACHNGGYLKTHSFFYLSKTYTKLSEKQFLSLTLKNLKIIFFFMLMALFITFFLLF